MDENKTNDEKAPEIGTLWAGPKSNVPCSVEHIAECNGDLVVAVGGMHIPLARFHKEWRPYTIISDDSRTAKEKRIKELAQELETAILSEANARLALDDAKAMLFVIEAAGRDEARERGLIDGKNKEARDDQEVLVVASAKIAQDHAAMLAKLEREYATARAVREGIEARVSLTRAWLYSQAPRT